MSFGLLYTTDTIRSAGNGRQMKINNERAGTTLLKSRQKAPKNSGQGGTKRQPEREPEEFSISILCTSILINASLYRLHFTHVIMYQLIA